MNDSATTVTWYLARSHDGEFCRGELWTPDIAEARLYRTIGPAKSAVTKRAQNKPEEPVAQILEWKLDIATATVIDMGETTRKAISRISKRKEDNLRRYKEERRAQLERELARETEELRRLSR